MSKKRRSRRPIIAVDFDGTLVQHRYPAIGDELPLAVDTVRELIRFGFDVVLWTCRTGGVLEYAVNWCEHRFPLYGVNHNPRDGRTGSKPYFALCIDDVAVGTPLTDEGWVDWEALRPLLWLRIGIAGRNRG